MPKKKTETSTGSLRHSIAVVSRRTGITQLRLRAWERRYEAVTPERTPTGRRLYSDADIEKLSLLKLLTESGHRISDIAGHALPVLRELVAQTPAAQFERKPEPLEPLPAQAYLADAMAAVSDLDHDGLRSALERALLDLSKPALRNDLLVPLLTEIGERWSVGHLRVAHEHMASTIVTSFVANLNSRQSPPPGAPLVVVATPSGHQHELGALLAASVALESGWKVLYLGRDLPAEDLAAAVRSKGAGVVLLSMVFPQGDAGVSEELRRLRRLVGPSVRILAGGRGAPSYAQVIDEIDAVLITNDAALTDHLSRH